MQVQIFSTYYPEHQTLYQDIFNFTKDDVSWVYPNYEKWYHETFIPDLKLGHRGYILASKHHVLTGCCLLKKTPEEQKICTLYVSKNYRRQGIGSDLLTAALTELNESPIITVSPGLAGEFTPLLSRFRFKPRFQMNPDNKDAHADIVFQQEEPVIIQRITYPNQIAQYKPVKARE